MKGNKLTEEIKKQRRIVPRNNSGYFYVEIVLYSKHSNCFPVILF